MPKIARNNFDASSTGTNIESVIMYDTHMSRILFEENIQILQGDGYRTTSIGYYIDSGNVDGSESVKFTVKGDRHVKEKWYLDNIRDEWDEVKAIPEEDLDAEILSHEEDVNLINYALDKLPEVDGLEFVPNKNLIVLTTRGYSQGDYARVIYCPEDLEKAWGNAPDQNQIQKMIDHYYWDAPIYACIEINGTEYNYADMPNYNEYEWDRDSFIEYVSKESGVDKDKLDPLVPQYPEYA